MVLHAFGERCQVDDLKEAMRSETGCLRLVIERTWYLSSLLVASGNKEQGGALHSFVQN